MVVTLSDLSDLLYADGVLRVLSAAMAHQVGAVDPVDEFSLCLEPLHGPCKPATHQANINLTHLKLWNDTWGYRLSAYHCVVYCPLQSVYLLTLPVFTCMSCLCLFCSLPRLSGVIDGLRDLGQRAKVDVLFWSTSTQYYSKTLHLAQDSTELMFCSSIKQEPLHCTAPTKQPNAPLIFTSVHTRR